MGSLSPAAADLQPAMFRPEGPVMLWDAWKLRRITTEEVACLLPDAWLYAQEPESVLPSDRWVAMLRATRFLVRPTNLDKLPSGPFAVFRAATTERVRGMAWYLDRPDAELILPRHERFGRAGVYLTEVKREAVLAHFKRGDEGPEVLLDPSTIGTGALTELRAGPPRIHDE